MPFQFPSKFSSFEHPFVFLKSQLFCCNIIICKKSPFVTQQNNIFYITFVSYVDSLDWKDTATPDSICKRVTSKVKNGSIVLFHNDADHTPEALPTILKCLKDEGYEFVFISDLILKENYEIKHDGTQCKITNN